MNIRKYGIELERLTENDIELVRKMRNKKEISKTMFFQEKISKTQQKKWFHSIDNPYNYYFLIKHNQKKIGLVHGKILSYSNKTAEGGIFIWEKSVWGTHIPVIVSICMADITFLILKMEKTNAEIRMDNPRAIEYNMKLGYEITEELKTEKKLRMQLTKDNYFEKANSIRQMVKNISRDQSEISWGDIEFRNEMPAHLYAGLPMYLQQKIEDYKVSKK
ncbi:MAG TPA: GNAT family protein [Flavobacteriaceae bacterium]|nr:GNAT family protein [Flavobacteriaceae bacterium]